MKRLLILAYYAPPLGMGGTQRVAKFCRYLPEFGWQPFLVTVKQPLYYAYDPELLRDLAACRVYRTESLDPQRVLARIVGTKATVRADTASRQRLGEWLNALFLPDSKLLWLPFALTGALRVAQRHRPHAILISSPPHSAQLAGLLLQNMLRIPWIADFRDRWCDGEFQPTRHRLGRRIDCLLAKFVASQAQGLVAVTKGLAGHLNHLVGRNDALTIYNGFDPTDFPTKSETYAGKKKLRIVFAGAVTQVSWPGALLDALEELLQRSSMTRSSLEVHFYGKDLTGKLEQSVVERGIADLVRIHGYVSHKQAVKALVEADVLYLPVSDNVSKGYVPGKLFEYLGSLRPVLATVPPGETRDLLLQSGASWVCNSRDAKCVAATIRLLHTLNQEGKLNKRPFQTVTPFARRNLAHRLAQYLDGLVGNVK